LAARRPAVNEKIAAADTLILNLGTHIVTHPWVVRLPEQCDFFKENNLPTALARNQNISPDYYLIPQFTHIQINKPIMASLPQMQTLTLDQLSDDILQRILDLAMARDSPFYIDDPRPGLDRSTYIKWSHPALESSTGAKDPNYTGCKGGSPQHHRTLQPVHRMDWIAINSTSRRIRTLGKVSFFRVKTFAMHQDLPARLQRNDPNGIKGMMPHDQALALSCIRDIVILNPRQSSPTTFLALPRMLAVFPCLYRCTLLFGFTIHTGYKYDGDYKGEADDVEWITAAFALGGPVPLKMQEHMAGIGMPRDFRLEEAMGPGSNWRDHRNLMETNIYPTLRVKSELLRAKEERERSTASQVVS
jgi:hypothetical protein